MIKCPTCGRECPEDAGYCLRCRTRLAEPQPFAPVDDAPADERSVGLLLGVGIFVLPVAFSWFTLRPGHTPLARMVAFGWLALSLVLGAISGSTSSGARAGPGSGKFGRGDEIAFMAECRTDMDEPTCACALDAFKAWPPERLQRLEALGDAPIERWPEDLRKKTVRELAVCAGKTISPSLKKVLQSACVQSLDPDQATCACIAHDFLTTRPPSDLEDLVEAGIRNGPPSDIVIGAFQSLSFKCSKKLGR